MSNIFATEFNKTRQNIIRYEHEFKRIFDLRLKDYYGSNALEMVLGFDIVKFGDALSKRHTGDPNWSNVQSPFSLEDMVLLSYKREGLDLINVLMK